ncbi:MAG: hypothetical protein ABIO70_30050 [Pseudomonadota bacterium]
MRHLSTALPILLVLNALLSLAIAQRYVTLRDAWQRQHLAVEGCARLRAGAQR